MSAVAAICVFASFLVRAGTYLFLRWVPSSVLPYLIYTGGALYAATAALLARRRTPRWRLSVLVGGLPDVSSRARRRLTAATVVINVVLVALATDFIYRSYYFYAETDLEFARVGYVTETEARLVVRSCTAPGPVVVYGRAGPAGERLDAVVPFSLGVLPAATDCTTGVTLAPLAPDTEYWYAVGDDSGVFRTAPRGRGQFRFLVTSCIKAHFPYNLLDHPLQVAGYRIYEALRQRAEFFLFLGDFTYADVPKLMGTDTEAYRRLYRQVYSDLRHTGFNQLPTVHVFDDHEIINDYDPLNVALYTPAIDAWKLYQHAANPEPLRPNVTYYAFERQGVPFFLMDTRSYRSLNHAEDGPGKSMLGAEQLADLLAWLDDVRDAPFKIVVSSCPFTKNWRGIDRLDTWAGYLHERATVLHKMWDAGNVIVLSGDRHEAAAIKFPHPDVAGTADEDDDARTVYEYSASPLNQFYIPIRTHVQKDLEDITIAYFPDGNHKIGHVAVDTDLDVPELTYELHVDGAKVWEHRVTSRPAPWHQIAAEAVTRPSGHGGPVTHVQVPGRRARRALRAP
ncbi:PhoD-like phosphatase-domain-containing protein [Dipodascopsis tothii]|uniref:PhoD-like phosphatase-domain-containing protein n=1 Tax=Dipodascopsis tothii TaxID=44089 RepID=UPI0034D00DC7